MDHHPAAADRTQQQLEHERQRRRLPEKEDKAFTFSTSFSSNLLSRNFGNAHWL